MHDDTELMAAIGRMVVNAVELECAVAELAATAEGLRGQECRERATAIVRRTGEAMRQFERLAQERTDLGWRSSSATPPRRKRVNTNGHATCAGGPSGRSRKPSRDCLQPSHCSGP